MALSTIAHYLLREVPVKYRPMWRSWLKKERTRIALALAPWLRYGRVGGSRMLSNHPTPNTAAAAAMWRARAKRYLREGQTTMARQAFANSLLPVPPNDWPFESRNWLYDRATAAIRNDPHPR